MRNTIYILHANYLDDTKEEGGRGKIEKNKDQQSSNRKIENYIQARCANPHTLESFGRERENRRKIPHLQNIFC